MKNNIIIRLKRIVTAVLTAAVMSVSHLACAEDNIRVILDGAELSFDAQPRITDGRVLVPMRAVFEALGAYVHWDDISHTAAGSKDGSVVIIVAGSRTLYKNSEAVELDVPAVIEDSRMLVPVRAVSEAFGCTVSWNGDTRTVTVSTQAADKYEIPPYSGEPYAVINGNEAYFEPAELVTEPFEVYSELDSLGRCGAAYANICAELMPEGERGSIGSVKPTGWHTVKYDFIDGKYLYNRCHLIAYQLAGENANERNLITGTRYLNMKGMLPFENMVADYVKETNNHVLYRVTPVFEGSNLVADGVLMEAKSVEDNGGGISFNVFCYNVQPGVIIDYKTGESSL